MDADSNERSQKAIVLALLLVAAILVHVGADTQTKGSQRAADRLLFHLLGRERADEVLGDLDELHHKERSQRGEAHARRRYALALFGLSARNLFSAAARLMLRKSA
jgi:hypothetical protein